MREYVKAESGLLLPRANAVEVQGTRWRGASQTLRSLATWWPGIGSATSDLPAQEQQTLRARSRDAFRGQMLARAAVTRSRTNIVGTGLMCRPSVDAKVLDLTDEEAAAYNADLRTRFEAWAESPVDCDMEATLDFYGQQGLALISAMLSGDVFALTPFEQRAGSVHGLKIQLIEADRVSNPQESMDSATRVDGIELAGGGCPVGVWIRSNHPGDSLLVGPATWNRYAVFGEATGRRRVLHIWNDKERPGQVRGAPYLAPILEPLRQIERYGGAELMAAVISAMLTVFIEHEETETDELGNPLTTFGAPAGAPALKLGNGAIVDLAPGEKANPVNPTRPNANFDPFFTAVAKQMGAALELPVDELMLHYQSSYSAARAAMLQAWRFYTMRRWFLTQQFCAPVYGLFLDEEVATGRLTLPGYADPIRRRAWTRALWIGPARGSMDERQEALAAQVRIDAGISNETIETAAMIGEDWEAVQAQRAREIAVRKANGTFVDKSKAAAPAPFANGDDTE
jgi:lambda family phage portal protein